MASDDEDELAAMRRARNAKLGIMEVLADRLLEPASVPV